jgi:protein-tyrosine phosphatase
VISTPLYWVNGPWPGKLAIAARPRGGDWLGDELQAWHRAGVSVVISALTADEAQELDLANEASECDQQGLDFVSFPIPDRGIPGSRADAESRLRNWEQRLRQGESLAVHCRQGIGRSALLAASLLRLAGKSASDAWREVGAARKAKVPDSSEQERWVSELAVGDLDQQETQTSKVLHNG